jgi:cytochrome b
MELNARNGSRKMTTVQVTEVRVWDPFVRVFHWLLATAVLIDWFTDDPLWLHTWLGYLAAILVVLRVIWGFIGTEQARFVSFVRGPRLVFDYLAGLVRFSSPRYLGHSPAGGAMIVALLIMIAATAGTGIAELAAERGQGPLAGVIDTRRASRSRRGGGKRCPSREFGMGDDYWKEAVSVAERGL